MTLKEKLDSIEEVLVDWDNGSEEYTSDFDVVDRIREIIDTPVDSE